MQVLPLVYYCGCLACVPCCQLMADLEIMRMLSYPTPAAQAATMLLPTPVDAPADSPRARRAPPPPAASPAAAPHRAAPHVSPFAMQQAQAWPAPAGGYAGGPADASGAGLAGAQASRTLPLEAVSVEALAGALVRSGSGPSHRSTLTRGWGSGGSTAAGGRACAASPGAASRSGRSQVRPLLLELCRSVRHGCQRAHAPGHSVGACCSAPEGRSGHVFWPSGRMCRVRSKSGSCADVHVLAHQRDLTKRLDPWHAMLHCGLTRARAFRRFPQSARAPTAACTSASCLLARLAATAAPRWVRLSLCVVFVSEAETAHPRACSSL